MILAGPTHKFHRQIKIAVVAVLGICALPLWAKESQRDCYEIENVFSVCDLSPEYRFKEQTSGDNHMEWTRSGPGSYLIVAQLGAPDGALPLTADYVARTFFEPDAEANQLETTMLQGHKAVLGANEGANPKGDISRRRFAVVELDTQILHLMVAGYAPANDVQAEFQTFLDAVTIQEAP